MHGQGAELFGSRSVLRMSVNPHARAIKLEMTAYPGRFRRSAFDRPDVDGRTLGIQRTYY